MPLDISILGVTGKMGRCVLAQALQDPAMRIIAATASSHSLSIGKDVGELFIGQSLGIALSSHVEQAMSLCDVAIDFSVREATLCHVHAAQIFKKALVIGTTGHGSEERRIIEKAAQDIPIVFSPNFSLGIALCLTMAAILGSTVFARSAIDIFETHHTHKKDQPSGTALALAQAIGKENISIHSERSGETVGEHRLVFDNDHERIEIKHTAHSRDAFAIGALLAAKKLAHMPAGLYTLKDLIFHG